jgi:hypothetical protein
MADFGIFRMQKATREPAKNAAARAERRGHERRGTDRRHANVGPPAGVSERRHGERRSGDRRHRG